jgi:hypothetical protein
MRVKENNMEKWLCFVYIKFRMPEIKIVVPDKCFLHAESQSATIESDTSLLLIKARLI